jgi:prefoldin subunit 5
MSAENDIHHNIGRHDAQIEALQEQIRLLHSDMQQLNAAITQIQQTLSEAKGGWRTLMWVGGAGAAVGVTASKFITWLASLPAPK